MSKLKKIVAVALCFIMIFSFSVVANAADPDSANLTTSYDDNGQYLLVTISTTNPLAGIQGTFTYNNTTAVNLLYQDTVFVNPENTADNSINYSAGSVRFVLLGDVTNGTKNWATFKFEVKETANVTFSLENVTACDVGETLITQAINGASIKVSVEALVTLGAQIRNTSTDASTDLRFGSKLVRSIDGVVENIVVDGIPYKATACGYLVAATNRITNPDDGSVAKMTVELANEQNSPIINIHATKCILSNDTYFIYTLVVTGITAKQKPLNICVTPYVAYVDNGVLKYFYGEQITKSANSVAASAYK
ncbi:MAG: hypothetical protein PHV07_04210 [Oscillospiraceae bacterium]|nr:hypothetical protein [Oscillospiraceae bacterium]